MFSWVNSNLHVGQVFAFKNHFLIHLGWKICKHGKTNPFSLFINSSKQIVQFFFSSSKCAKLIFISGNISIIFSVTPCLCEEKLFCPTKWPIILFRLLLKKFKK